jgi:multidrug transporter EmrE-like cation transporter
LSSPPSLVSHPVLNRVSERQRSLILVSLCTVLGAGAQILMKKGADPSIHGMIPTIARIFTNLDMFLGYALYGISAVLLVLALRRGQLSLLYPVIALTFVWVAILSVVVFHETLSPVRIAGITTVVLGVGLLGLGSTPATAESPVSASGAR